MLFVLYIQTHTGMSDVSMWFILGLLWHCRLLWRQTYTNMWWEMINGTIVQQKVSVPYNIITTQSTVLPVPTRHRRHACIKMLSVYTHPSATIIFSPADQGTFSKTAGQSQAYYNTWNWERGTYDVNHLHILTCEGAVSRVSSVYNYLTRHLI